MKKPSIFEFNRMVVGEFVDGQHPVAPGDFNYIPHRSLGHLQMQEALRSNREVVCTFTGDGTDFIMRITAQPQYGVLTATEIRTAK